MNVQTLLSYVTSTIMGDSRPIDKCKGPKPGISHWGQYSNNN